MYHSSYLGVSFGQIKASTAPIAIPILKRLPLSNFNIYPRSMPKSTSGLWRREALLLKSKQPREHSCPLTGIIRSLPLSVAVNGIFKEQRRKVEQEGSLPPHWSWLDESREGWSKWSEILQRVLFPQVEEGVSQFEICKGLPGVHCFQLSRGVVIYSVRR